MYNNEDYGASFHYMYIQSSYSNSGAVSRHSYVMPYCQYYMLHIASVYQGNGSCLNTSIKLRIRISLKLTSMI